MVEESRIDPGGITVKTHIKKKEEKWETERSWTYDFKKNWRKITKVKWIAETIALVVKINKKYSAEIL